MRLAQLIAAAALGLAAAFAHALEIKPYTAAALSEAQQAGKPVALHFHADWCPTCRAQQQVFNDLRSDAALDLTLLVADYDKEKELKRKLNVRTQSTLIVYRGTTETSRLAGETDAAKLKAALRSSL